MKDVMQATRANIVSMLPDGRYIVAVGAPIYTREEVEALYEAMGKELKKLPTATGVPKLARVG